MERRHAPGFAKLAARASVVALADVSEARLAVIAGMLGVPREHCYTDYTAMLAREKLDLVDITSPHHLHAEQAIAAAQAGCHVLMEKPIARTPDEARAAIAAAQAAGVKLCVLHNQLFTPASLKLRELLASGELGEPFLVRSELIGGSAATGRGADQGWRMSVEGSGGGALIDSGYHQTYLARAWMGSPVRRVYARMGRFVHDYEVEDLSLVTLEHENGGLTSLQSGFCAPGGIVGMQEVVAKRGQARVNFWADPPLDLWTADEPQWRKVPCAVEEPDEVGWPALVGAFLEAIEGRGEVPVSGEDSLEIIAIIAAAYESARRGEAVEVAPNGS